jgi:hypothetical protein
MFKRKYYVLLYLVRHIFLNKIHINVVGSNPDREFWFFFIWGSYPASLRNVGGSTQAPVRAWNNARKGAWGLASKAGTSPYDLYCGGVTYNLINQTNKIHAHIEYIHFLQVKKRVVNPHLLSVTQFKYYFISLPNRVCNSLVILLWLMLPRDHFLSRFLYDIYRQ